MSIRNLKDGSKNPWLCECYPSGRKGKRIRKKFATKGEAATFERFTMKEVDDKPWLGDKEDNRRLLDLIYLWHRRHGLTLVHEQYTLRKLETMGHGMGNPLALKFTAQHFTKFREQRMAGEIADMNGRKVAVSKRTCNNELSLLHAVFTELARMGEWKYPPPLITVRHFKLHEQEMAYLTIEQIRYLLDEAAKRENPHLVPIIKVCLATGARFREAEQLTTSQLNRYKITYTKTKGKKNRTIPISKELHDEIYQPTSGRLFSNCYSSMFRLITKCFPDLPDGQASHVMRHTFASHFMMNNGNILVLQRILGHSDIKHTMRYSHFAPDHFDDALSKNPLIGL
ncbi:tyrosine-type recombinase/integrase [Photobacterium phosphoreum]|uniref:Tyrosine-type recombinase/integrase n=1 Tax=Photobacterium phosphoreum TaxID=659 RepID=A0AAW4ZKJ1_PHOPO|nr:tyrosine-type recombinase/integrase [Photobacterium phosphoreum]MCD9491092.1 tyrosine-type recombinase/integrase [Photobacterium phosphoreum]MCF2190298.1 tyrosine-type recombinase/integrase [Photobacterium phosphoreum]MCF2300885.1 tyrosine-type recombinase/integrase [Photobacterium phosphoreum]